LRLKYEETQSDILIAADIMLGLIYNLFEL